MEIKDDLYAPGSSYTIGVGNQNNGQAQRQGYVFGPVSESISASDAAIAWWSNNGSLYPGGVGALPLQTVTGLVEDKNNVRIIARYGYAGAGYPTASSALLTSISASTYNFRSWRKAGSISDYDVYGRPTGALNFVEVNATPGKNRSYPPAPINYPMTETVFYVPTTLDYNPYSLVQGRLGRINSNNVTFAGVTFLPNTVKFVNCYVRAVQIQDEVRYVVEYTFIARAAYWVDELPPVWDLTNLIWTNAQGAAIPSGNTWYNLNTQPISFGAGFPVYL